MIRTALAGLLVFLGVIAGPAAAQDRPGRFDFYVLALSWSPGFCALGDNRARRSAQCADGRHGFVVHGLWPQHERGYPEYCGRAAWVPERLIREMRDIMPSRGLVVGQWRKHGTCTGMEPSAYFETLRRARERIRIPAAFTGGQAPASLSPDEVEGRFLAANPGLERNMMAVQCGERTLSEVRICMTRDLAFRACPEVDRRACRLPQIRVPASGGMR